MNATDNVLLIIVASLLAIFLLLAILILVVTLKTIMSLKRTIYKAETLINSVESATEVLKGTKGRFTSLKLISNLINIASRK
jgi:hypothetical protein